MTQSEYLCQADVETILAGFGVRLELPEPDRMRRGRPEWRAATVARLIRDAPRRREPAASGDWRTVRRRPVGSCELSPQGTSG
jgi:hypothetical protein